MVDDFFSDIEQVRHDIDGLSIPVPTFYQSARTMSAVFPAKLSRLREIVPDRRLVPAQLVPGVGSIQVAAMEYFESDIGSRYEVVVAVPLCSPDFSKIPGYNTVRQLLRMDFHLYMYRVPVMDEAAVVLGRLSGWPNFVSSLEFSDIDGWWSCEWKEEGALVLRLQGRKVTARRKKVLRMFCHVDHGEEPMVNEGRFNSVEFVMSYNPGNAKLELGSDNPTAKTIEDALITTMPMMYMYAPKTQLILFGPQEM